MPEQRITGQRLTELKPCRVEFCKAAGFLMSQRGKYWIECRGCSCCTPTRDTESEAAELWNERPGDAVTLAAQKAANALIAAHSEAYRKADLARNEDAMSFIAGLRDGATGVRDAIFADLLPPKETNDVRR